MASKFRIPKFSEMKMPTGSSKSGGARRNSEVATVSATSSTSEEETTSKPSKLTRSAVDLLNMAVLKVKGMGWKGSIKVVAKILGIGVIVEVYIGEAEVEIQNMSITESGDDSAADAFDEIGADEEAQIDDEEAAALEQSGSSEDSTKSRSIFRRKASSALNGGITNVKNVAAYMHSKAMGGSVGTVFEVSVFGIGFEVEMLFELASVVASLKLPRLSGSSSNQQKTK